MISPVQTKHFRTLFRVLRPDEFKSRIIKPVKGKDDKRSLRDTVFEHVTDGSSHNYRSPLISCTSELNVALSFGGILSRIAVIDPRNIDERNGPESSTGILTHGSLDARLPSTLCGFGAVVDPTDQRVVLFGGGQPQSNTSGHKSLGRSMGRASTHEQPFRILYLSRTMDGHGREEWKWEVNEDHELLDTSFRLPVRASWSACLINHTIILFGGRHGNQFTNETIVLQLRPNFVNALEEITESTRSIHCTLDAVERKWGVRAAEDVRKRVLDILMT